MSLSLALLSPAGAQDEIPRPDIFFGSASAVGASFMADRAGLLPIPEVFRFIALDGEATYETYNQAARASLFFPGNGVIQGPNLACGTFGGQFPAEFGPLLQACTEAKYPLTVYADSLAPEASSVGGLQLGSRRDPVSAHSVRAAASALPEATTTDAAMQDLRIVGLEAGRPDTLLPVPGLPELDATILSVDSLTARTDQRIDESVRLVADARSTLQGVRLAGGLVEIGSIRSRSVVTDDGDGTQTHDAVLEVSGVTVAGVPAQITEQGLVVGAPGGSGPQADQVIRTVNQILEGMNFRISALDAETGVDDVGIAYARSGGVLVEFGHDVVGLPRVPGPMGEVDPNGFYEGTIVLGATGATGIAAAIPPFEIDIVAPVVPPAAPLPPVDAGEVSTPMDSAPPSDANPSLSESVDVAGGTSDSGSGAEDAVPAQESRRTDVPTSAVVSVFDPLVADLRWIYLAFTLSALGLALSPRFSLPARLPRSRP